MFKKKQIGHLISMKDWVENMEKISSRWILEVKKYHVTVVLPFWALWRYKKDILREKPFGLGISFEHFSPLHKCFWKYPKAYIDDVSSPSQIYRGKAVEEIWSQHGKQYDH